ncbi:hypothetical protein IWW57_005231 [Coemansia sp. S610]|nr:hypothetical protein IWW57_005231 [Coemansia sp. S610]KAJ2416280.1 hypothetical protein GGI10_001077 [Coemansia sp. RSA 2530]
MARKLWSWRACAWYVGVLSVVLALLPFAIPLSILAYAVVWVYTWTHDPRARKNFVKVLPIDPRRVFRCGQALWAGMLDGLGGPTAALVWAFVAAKLSRSTRAQDTAVRDIQYGPLATHRLDLFVPLSTATGAVIVIFPGYRWSRTKRARMYRPMAQTLCGDGLFVVLPRVGSQGSPGDALEDFNVAVQWVVANAANFGADAGRVHVMGCGAGAHLCAMYSLAAPLRTWYAQADRMARGAQLLASADADAALRRAVRRIHRPPRVAGLVLVSGVYDIVAQRRYEADRCIENLTAAARAFAKGEEEAWSPALAVRALRRRSAVLPPELFPRSVLLIHGRLDSTFELAQSQRMFRELCAVGVPDVQMKIYANLRRVDPAIALLAPRSALAQSLLEDIRASVKNQDTQPSPNQDA